MRNAQQAGTVENFAQGYQDYLQAPLQVCSRVILSVGGDLDNLTLDFIAPDG